MRIAQLSVAGEAVSRPLTSELPPDGGDQQALHEYACDRSNLPWVIFRAAHRATHTSALPARARALLAALARTVDAGRPYAAIFARRELLTGRAQQSMRTFYRGLDDLETAGFITRPPQTRYGGAGLFGRAYLHLTPKAAALLGLIETANASAKPDASPPEAEARTKPALSFATPSVTVADGPIYKDLIPTTQKRQPGRLPADLQRLLSLGFREFLIFKLMREAKRHGKLLSNVVEATWEHLRRATHPISYLRTLLRAPFDFASRVRHQRAAIEAQEQSRTRAQQTRSAVAGLAGQDFVSRDGLRTYRVSDDARCVTIHHRDEPHPRVHAGAWGEGFIAAIDAGHIVPADCDVASEQTVRPDAAKSAGAAEPGSGITPSSKPHLDELKQLLRLKQAGVVPTFNQRTGTMHPKRSVPVSASLRSLLQLISGTAPSTKTS